MPSTTSATLTPPSPDLDARVSTRTPVTVLYVPAALERTPVAARLGELGLSVTAAADAADAVRLLRNKAFTVALVHLADERPALAAIRAIRSQMPQLAVAGLMDPARPIATAEAFRSGVADLLTWPLDEHDVAAFVANAQERMSIGSDLAAFAASTDTLFANSPAMRVLMDRVRAVASEPGGVFVLGERGTGRELVAEAVHARSNRAHGPFIAVDCANGSLHDLEVRIFGLVTDRRAPGHPERRIHERVGSSGAVYRANGGTLFLKNVVEAPTRVQAKIVRLLRDREALVADDRSLVDLDFRVMASVDAGLDAAIAEERLQRDLYERLAQCRLDVPAFRRRREDIPLIAMAVLAEVCARQGVPAKTCSRAALSTLSVLPWPANGRELRTLLEALVTSVTRPVIQLDDLLEHVRLDGLAARVEAGGTLREAKARFERDWISAVLMKHHGRVGEAAKALGIQRTNLYRKVRQLKVARTLLGPRKR